MIRTDSDDAPAIVPDTPTPWDLDERTHALAFQVERLTRRLNALEELQAAHLEAYRRHVSETHAGWSAGRPPGTRPRPLPADVVDGAPGKVSGRTVAVARNAHNSAQQSARRTLRTRTVQRERPTTQRSFLEGETR